MEKFLLEKKQIFINKVIDKRQLKSLMSDIFNKYGTTKCTYVADRLKLLGFRYATQAGLSLNIEDLRVPDTKKQYLQSSEKYIKSVEESFARADINSVDLFQCVIDKWSSVSDKVKDEVVNYFVKFDPFNPIYMMAFSGARGNLSQVRQLIGMRGLMADPQGQLIGLPIKSNFREGLTVTEYIISSYGARKGIVDTALRTADSGYLTRRLVDVSQDIIIRSHDCFTKKGICTAVNSSQELIGRTVLVDVFDNNGNILLKKNEQIDHYQFNLLKKNNIENVYIRSSITCQLNHSICQLCYGWNLATRKLIDIGEAVGILAAQSIGEPGTQLTMRTFHTGGTFMGTLSDATYSFSKGHLKAFGESNLFKPSKFSEGSWNIKVLKETALQLQKLDGRLFSLKIPKNSSLLIEKNNLFVDENQMISKPPIEESTASEQVTKRILSDREGLIFFDNLKIQETQDKSNNIKQIVQNQGFLWISLGNVINIPLKTFLQVKQGDFLQKNKCIMKSSEKNTFEGFCIVDNHSQKESVLLSSSELQENNIKKLNNGHFLLSSFGSKKEYHLSFTKYSFSENKQIIGEFVLKNIFKSESGRIKFNKFNFENASQKVKSTENIHRIHLIPEFYFENIEICKNLFVKAGDFIEKGAELFSGVFANDSGIVDIDILDSNENIGDLILRPGIFVNHDSFYREIFIKSNKKILPKVSDLGDFSNLVNTDFFHVEQLCFDNKNESFLISNVETFDVSPIKEFTFKNKYESFIFKKPFRIFERTDFLVEDGEILKNLKDHKILKNQLIFNFKLPKEHFSSKIILKKFKNNSFKLFVDLYENFNLLPVDKLPKNKTSIRIQKFFHKNQYIYSLSKIFENQVISSTNGIVDLISSDKRIICLSNKNNYQIFSIENISEKEKKFLNKKYKNFLRRGEKSQENSYIQSAGKYVNTEKQSEFVEYIFLQRSKPYLIAKNSIIKTKEGSLIKKNDLIAFLTYEIAKTEDIIQGLPRVEEILEARPPKNKAIISRIPGFISVIEENLTQNNNSLLGKNDFSTIVIQNNNDLREKYLIPQSRKIVRTGNFVSLGERLTDGQIDMRELLQINFIFYKNILGFDNYLASLKSFRKLQLILINEIQLVYKSQGVDISNKHIEIIVRQMTTKVKIEESGETTLVPGEIVDLEKVRRVNTIANYHKFKLATYSPVLLGITKASLSTDSFISAASFQETARVLTKAAVEGKKDWLKGLKENVIVGRLIPAGTGLKNYYSSDNNEEFSKNLEGDNFSKNIKDLILDNRIKNRE